MSHHKIRVSLEMILFLKQVHQLKELSTDFFFSLYHYKSNQDQEPINFMNILYELNLLMKMILNVLTIINTRHVDTLKLKIFIVNQ